MRIPISAVTVGEVTCREAVVSVAVSSTVAVRVVPVDGDGVEHVDAAFGVVGGDGSEDVAAFLASVSEAVSVLVAGRAV